MTLRRRKNSDWRSQPRAKSWCSAAIAIATPSVDPALPHLVTTTAGGHLSAAIAGLKRAYPAVGGYCDIDLPRYDQDYSRRMHFAPR